MGEGVGFTTAQAKRTGKMVGRFLQADSVSMPESTFGMNRYMYMSGNPVNYNDPSGHCPAKANYAVAGNYLRIGRCGSKLPNWWKEDLLFAAFILRGDWNSALALYIIN